MNIVVVKGVCNRQNEPITKQQLAVAFESVVVEDLLTWLISIIANQLASTIHFKIPLILGGRIMVADIKKRLQDGEIVDFCAMRRETQDVILCFLREDQRRTKTPTGKDAKGPLVEQLGVFLPPREIYFLQKLSGVLVLLLDVGLDLTDGDMSVCLLEAFNVVFGPDSW